MPYQSTIVVARDGSNGGGAVHNLAAYSGGGLPEGTIAIAQIDPGIGNPSDAAATSAQLAEVDQSVVGILGLIPLFKGALKTLGDRGDLSSVTSIAGLLKKIAENTATSGGSSSGSGATSSAGIGDPADPPASVSTLASTPATPLGLVGIGKASLSLVSKIQAAIGTVTDAAVATGDGSIISVIRQIRANTALGPAAIGTTTDLPTSLTTLATTPATPAGLVSLGKSIFLVVGSSIGAIVAPGAIESATTTPYSIAFMVRMLLGQVGNINTSTAAVQGSIGTTADPISASATGGTISSLLRGVYQKALSWDARMTSITRDRAIMQIGGSAFGHTALSTNYISGPAVRIHSVSGLSYGASSPMTGVDAAKPVYLFLVVAVDGTSAPVAPVGMPGLLLDRPSNSTTNYRMLAPPILLKGTDPVTATATTDALDQFELKTVGAEYFGLNGLLVPAGFAFIASSTVEKFTAPINSNFFAQCHITGV